MKEKKDSLRIRVGKSSHVREVAERVNKAIKDGWTIEGLRVDEASASDTYLDVLLSKAERRRDFFDAGFSSRTKLGKMRAKKPLR